MLCWFLRNESAIFVPICVCVCVCVCVSRPTPLGHPQSTKLSPLCYMGASHQLSVLHMVVYICLCYSLNSSHLPPHPCVHYVKIKISKDFVLVGPVQIWHCKWQCFYWTSSMPCLCFSSTRRILILKDARDVRLSHSYFFCTLHTTGQLHTINNADIATKILLKTVVSCMFSPHSPPFFFLIILHFLQVSPVIKAPRFPLLKSGIGVVLLLQLMIDTLLTKIRSLHCCLLSVL